MTECGKRERDPFLATGEYWIDHCVLQRAMKNAPRKFKDLDFATIQSKHEWLENDDSSTIGGTRSQNNKNLESKAFYGRLWTAAVAGAFLLGPMWLMVLHHTLYTALVSTTVVVVMFGFLMA
jgi:hypothetical protein